MSVSASGIFSDECFRLMLPQSTLRLWFLARSYLKPILLSVAMRTIIVHVASSSVGLDMELRCAPSGTCQFFLAFVAAVQVAFSGWQPTIQLWQKAVLKPKILRDSTQNAPPKLKFLFSPEHLDLLCASFFFCWSHVPDRATSCNVCTSPVMLHHFLPCHHPWL